MSATIVDPAKLLLEKDDAAVIFKKDGTIQLCVPEMGDPDSEVPLHVLAATEIMMEASEVGIEVLAEEFEERVKAGH